MLQEVTTTCPNCGTTEVHPPHLDHFPTERHPHHRVYMREPWLHSSHPRRCSSSFRAALRCDSTRVGIESSNIRNARMKAIGDSGSQYMTWLASGGGRLICAAAWAPRSNTAHSKSSFPCMLAMNSASWLTYTTGNERGPQQNDAAKPVVAQPVAHPSLYLGGWERSEADMKELYSFFKILIITPPPPSGAARALRWIIARR